MSKLECIIQMVGGLGNQMFQYALGRRLQIDRGAGVRFDLSMYKTDTERALTLGNLRARIPKISSVDKCLTRLSFGRTLSRFKALAGPFKKPLLWEVYEDPKTGFDPTPLRLQGRWYLRGWWQSPVYFQSIRALLLEEFEPAAPLPPADVEMVKQVQSTNAICLHVRRGDLVSNPNYNRDQQVQTAGYYAQCLREMCQRVEAPHIFVFSDDMPWCKENIFCDAPVTFMDKHDGRSDYIDLHLMSHCRHFITANSTFSWWGAWLSQHAGKIVIVPPVWRFAQKGPPPDLIPSGWQIGPMAAAPKLQPAEEGVAP